VIIVAPSERQRIGITVTKRVARAVGRNRIKRLVREVFRRNRSLFPACTDTVIVARAGAQRMSYAQVLEELGKAAPALARAARKEAT
jgi:ribonuclease P protein component